MSLIKLRHTAHTLPAIGSKPAADEQGGVLRAHTPKSRYATVKTSRISFSIRIARHSARPTGFASYQLVHAPFPRYMRFP